MFKDHPLILINTATLFSIFPCLCASFSCTMSMPMKSLKQWIHLMCQYILYSHSALCVKTFQIICLTRERHLDPSGMKTKAEQILHYDTCMRKVCIKASSCRRSLMSWKLCCLSASHWMHCSSPDNKLPLRSSDNNLLVGLHFSSEIWGCLSASPGWGWYIQFLIFILFYEALTMTEQMVTCNF